MRAVQKNEDNEMKDKSDNRREMEMKPKDKNDAAIKDTPVSQSRRLITAR